MDILNLDGGVLASGASINDILRNETSPSVWGPRRKSFRRADLRGLALESAMLCASNALGSLRRSDFTEADFSGANLKFARFVGLDLRRANFSDCDLRGASFTRCDLDEAIFDRVAMHRHTEGSTGHYPTMLSCSLRRARAHEADFTGAVLGAASAEGSIWRECEFDTANFGGNWDEAVMLGCDLHSARPGTESKDPSHSGCSFGVFIDAACNTRDLLLTKCPTVPQPLPDGFVLDPEDEPEVDLPDSDRFEREQEARSAAERQKAVAARAERREQAAGERRKRQEAVRAAWEQEQGALAAEARKRQLDEHYEQERTDAVAAAARPALTCSFVDPPATHDGQPFRMRVAFSQPLSTGYADVRDRGFSVSGGRITGACRVDRRSDLWQLTVAPAGDACVVLTATPVLRAAGNKQLEVATSATIPHAVAE